MRRPGSKYAVQMPLWAVLLFLAAAHVIYFHFFSAPARPAAQHAHRPPQDVPQHVHSLPDVVQPAARIPRSWNQDQGGVKPSSAPG
jgi:hypothetical protein